MSVWFALLLAAAPPAGANAGDLVHAERGTLPVVLSAPHGGRAAVPGVPPRTGAGKSGAANFTTVRDTRSDVLAVAIADALETRTGRRPSLVLARFDRNYIDANRPPADAYEHARARPAYDLYHETLAAFVRDLHDRPGGGLLIDVHGQAREKDAVIRGTRNGLTTGRGHAARTDHRFPNAVGLRLSDALRARGLTVLPGGDGRETVFTGGYITVTHGVQRPGGVPAVQLEFGSHLRRSAAIPATADAVADALLDLGLPGLARVAGPKPAG